jgi:prepilin-type N-terminal cleavage/methylation domain-containing protein
MKRGFTLIELITTVIIIAILVSMAVPTYNKAVENAREREARTGLELIYNAQKLYRVDKATYAGTFAALASYIENPNNKSQYYTFAITAAAANTFTATATRNNDATKVFTITQSGTITP